MPKLALTVLLNLLLKTEKTSVVAPPMSTPTTDMFSLSAIFLIISPTAPGVGIIGTSAQSINL